MGSNAGDEHSIKGPLTDHAYSLARVYGDLSVGDAYDLPQLRQNAAQARKLATMLGDGLQAVHDIVEDDKLWDALGSAREGIDSQQFEDLIGFTEVSLEPLLNAFGYKSPPPLYELVGRTQAALILAGDASRQRRLSGEELRDARHYLRFLLDRTREKLDPRFAPRHAVPVMAAARSQLLNMMITIIPAVVGAAAAGALGLPTDLAPVAIEGGKEFVKQAGEMAAGSLVGLGLEHARKDVATLPGLQGTDTYLARLWISIEALNSIARTWAKERKPLEDFPWVSEQTDATWRTTCATTADVAGTALKDYILAVQSSHELDDNRRSFIMFVEATLRQLHQAPNPYFALDQIGLLLERIRQFTGHRRLF